MKKIFAIALALVMVLSMASAFAVIKKDCVVLDFNWTCATENSYCGKGKVEVVPLVKNAIACEPYWTWSVSECAGAMPSEFIYYAIKVTVDAYPNTDWWNAADFEIEYDGAVAGITDANLDTALAKLKTIMADADYEEDKANSYYLKSDSFGWIDAEDVDFDEDPVVFGSEVTEKDVEVCVTLASEDDGIGEYEYDGYTFYTSLKQLGIQKGSKYVIFKVNEDGKIDEIQKTDVDFYNEVTSKFNLNCGIGTCVNKDNLKAIFGWDDEFENCFSWNAMASAIVDAECVVAIPKTGDASVLAWLF